MREPTQISEHMFAKLLYEFCLCRTHFDKIFSPCSLAQFDVCSWNQNDYSIFGTLDEAEKPADLSQKIVFKAKKKEKPDESSENNDGEKSVQNPQKPERSKRKKGKPVKNLLSFEDEDDEG